MDMAHFLRGLTLANRATTQCLPSKQYGRTVIRTSLDSRDMGESPTLARATVDFLHRARGRHQGRYRGAALDHSALVTS
jgi:hypothetical protein